MLQSSFAHEETGSETAVEYDDSPTKSFSSKLVKSFFLNFFFCFLRLYVLHIIETPTSTTKRGRVIRRNPTPGNLGKYYISD